MRVLFVEHKQVFGGGQVALLNLLRAWRAAQVEIEPVVVCSPTAALVPRLRTEGIPFHTLNFGAIEKTRGVAANLIRRIRPTMQLVSLMRRLQTQIVYANGAYSFLAAVGAAKLLRVPIIWIEHNTTLPNSRVLGQMIRQADHIIAVTNVIRDQFVSLVPKAQTKLTVIYNGVDPDEFRTADAPSLHARAAFGWSEQNMIVGTVSRLAPEKGVNYFVEAAAIVLREFPTARFLVVGEGEEREKLRTEIERLEIRDWVCLAGFREDVPELLSTMDVFVLASLEEAFPISILEAMAAARPVVATDVGGVREAVIDGETGFVVPPRDAGALARAVSDLLRDDQKRRAFGQAGRTRVVEHFTLAQMAEETHAILKAVSKRA